MAVKWRCTACF